MLRVYAQLTPQPTGQSFRNKDGTENESRWCRARLLEVGFASTFEEAKRLTPYPITEEVTDPVH